MQVATAEWHSAQRQSSGGEMPEIRSILPEQKSSETFLLPLPERSLTKPARLLPPSIQLRLWSCRQSPDCGWPKAVPGLSVMPTASRHQARQTLFASAHNTAGSARQLLREKKETPRLSFEAVCPRSRCPRQNARGRFLPRPTKPETSYLPAVEGAPRWS